MASMLIGDPEMIRYHTRATRSTKAFSRQTVGAAFPLGFKFEQLKPGKFRIPVIWGRRPVEFTLRPVQGRLRVEGQPQQRAEAISRPDAGSSYH